MSESDAKVVLVPGAWADGSSWSKVINGLQENGVSAVTVPVPLTTLDDDVAALDRTLERIEGPVVLVGHAYAGAVIEPRAIPGSRRWSTSPRLPRTREKR
jgi:predicted alpha/beta hydrolase family esterase